MKRPMRVLAPCLMLLIAVLPAMAPAIAPPDALVTLDAHAMLCLRHLRTVRSEDRHFVRFLSWLAVPRAKLARGQQVVRWWLNQLSTEQAVALPAVVRGSAGLLWAVDLRDYRWSAAAWRAVARREPYFREPWLLHEVAYVLRLRIGEVALEDADGTIHVIAVVRADWLFRETIESARSTSYYDLLYARERFKAGKVVNFPADEKDWNDFFGIKAVADFLAKQKIDVKRGAVVAGSRDDPVRGSIVARQNRVIQILPIPTGVALKTFDVKKTAGDTDFIEKVPEIAVGKIKFDAGELLASLPNGGQAGLLINGLGKRIEFATGEFVHPKFADARTPDVRTMMGCVVCHGPEGGLIPPRDMFKELLKSGVDLKIKDREARNRVKAFFLEWDDEVKGWQRPYTRLIERSTGDPLVPGRSLSAVALAKEFLVFRDWYDDPVTPDQAAAEMGLPLAEVRLALATDLKKWSEEKGKPVPVLGLARLKQLVVGSSIPRQAWEEGVFRDANLLYLLVSKRGVR